MLCFGQSAFFRFNHPEEALRMKSMLPGGSQGLTTTKTHPTGKEPALMRIRHRAGSVQLVMITYQGD